MRIHRYHGLFGDRRDQGVWKALGVSLVLHAALFLAFGRFHIRPVERTFYAPIHVVNLVERPGPKGARGGPAAPRPKPKSAPKPKPKAPAPKPAARTPPKPAPKPKPAAKSPAKPAPPKAAAAVPAEPAPSPAPAAEPNPEALERKIAERIAALREKHGDPLAAGPAGPSTELGERRVGQAIEAIRKRLDAASAQGPGGSGATGLSGRRSALEEVRLRAYYNRLWDRVNEHWAIPPGLKGRDLSVIVSVVIDRAGRIQRLVVEESSGSDAFDRAALAALERAQPLPPIPDEVADDTLEVGFRFHGE
ncbi:energy transducer TonB [Deferrisoma palaeochoriense]